MIRFVFLFIRRGKVSVYAIAFLFPFFSCCSPCGFLMNALKFNIESQISSTEKCIHMKQKNATEQQAIRIEWDNENMAYIEIYVARLLFTLEHSEQRQRTHEWEVNKNQEKRSDVVSVCPNMDGVLLGEIQLMSCFTLWVKCVPLCIPIHATANDSCITNSPSFSSHIRCSAQHAFLQSRCFLCAIL